MICPLLAFIFISEGNTFPFIFLINIIFFFYLTRHGPVKLTAINTSFIIISFIMILYLAESQFGRVRVDGRLHLNHIDPNFSGVGLFLFFSYFTSIKKYKYALVLFIISLLLLSRATILSMLIFLVLSNVRQINRNKIYSLMTSSVGLISGLSFLILFALMSVIQSYLGDFQPTQIEGTQRLITFADNSNIGRFMKFALAFELMGNTEYIFSGPGSEIFGAILPHNSLMFIFTEFGTASTAAHLLFLFMIKNSTTEQKAISCAFIFYSMFLHGLLLGIYFLSFLFIHHKMGVKN